MKVISIKEPFATLIMNGSKKSRQEVGKLIIEVKSLFMQAVIQLKRCLIIIFGKI